jgi:hypothetical protein
MDAGTRAHVTLEVVQESMLVSLLTDPNVEGNKDI